MKSKKLKTSGIALAAVIIIVTLIHTVNIQPVATGDLGEAYYELKNFNSYADLTEFLTADPGYSYGSGWGISPRSMMFGEEMMIDGDSINSGTSSSVKSGGVVVDYSQTNVQVQGVDEPDIVKTDGKYLYIVSGNKVIVVKAIPAEDALIECEIEVNDSLTIQNIFVSQGIVQIGIFDEKNINIKNEKINLLGSSSFIYALGQNQYKWDSQTYK